MTMLSASERQSCAGRGGIYYYRWAYGVPARIGGRVRVKQPGCPWNGQEGVITGAGPGIVVKLNELPAGYAKRWRWRGHPLELEYLDADKG